MTADLFGAPSTLLPPGETPRGKWKWPELPHPVTGEVQLWRRPSKITEPLEDTYALNKWKQRATAKGIAMREDLRALAYACDFTDKADAAILDDVAWRAQQAAGTSTRSTIGTARHKLFDAYDRTGAIPPASEADMHRDVTAYAKACAEYGIRMAPDLIERSGVTTADGVDAAGMWDRILWREGWPLPRIGDAKTGDDVLTYHQLAYAAQMATYARACVMLPRQWDTARGADQYEPMPAVDQQWGLVIHVAAGSGVVTFIDVDLAAGWEAVLLARDVDRWRKRKDLLIPVWTSAPPAAPEPAEPSAVEALAATAREIAAEPPVAVGEGTIGEIAPDGGFIAAARLKVSSISLVADPPHPALALNAAPTVTGDGKLDMATASSDEVLAYLGEGVTEVPRPAPRKRAPRKPPARKEIAETATGVLADLAAMHERRRAAGDNTLAAPPVEVVTVDPEVVTVADVAPAGGGQPECAHGVLCGPCHGLPITEWTLAEKVREAPTVEVLSELWQANQAYWSDELTALGTARAEQLSTPKPT